MLSWARLFRMRAVNTSISGAALDQDGAFLFGWTSAWIQGPGWPPNCGRAAAHHCFSSTFAERADIHLEHSVSVSRTTIPLHIHCLTAVGSRSCNMAAINYFGVRTAGQFQI